MNRPLKAFLITGLLLVGVAVCAGLAPYYSTIAVWELREWAPVLAVIASVTAGGLVLGMLGRMREGMIAFGAFVGLAVGLLWVAHINYQQDRSYSTATMVTADPLPQFAGRAPYQVGQAQARPNLGDTAGDIADTTYLPGDDRYATLVNRRGFLSGYEAAFTQQIPLQGRGSTDQKCEFDRDRAEARSGGYFTHNLGRLISKEQRWVRFDGEDIYAYCDGDRPVVVVPLKRQVGILAVTERPAGAALYDGKTGELTITTDTAKIPGPSYPLSLARQQREATRAIGSFTDWLFKRSGWETPDDDINSGNDAEFTLDAGGTPMYATPLTGRGSATAISVVTTVPARHSGLRLAPLRAHKLKPVWVSPGAIVDKITADYQDIPNWQTIKVYEVIPTGPNAWVATLGTGQNILYRATGTGDLKGDKPTCLLRADGSPYRCGTLAGVSGNGIGTQYGSDPTAPAPVHSGDLRSMSDAEFAALQRRVAEEAACRLDKATCQRR